MTNRTEGLQRDFVDFGAYLYEAIGYKGAEPGPVVHVFNLDALNHNAEEPEQPGQEAGTKLNGAPAPEKSL